MYAKDIVKKILVPVQLDACSLTLARQAAELARVHDAELLLLHVADIKECPYRFLSFFTRKGAETYHRLTREKNDLLNTWKRWLEKEYHVKTQVQVEWGRRGRMILETAAAAEADMIAVSGESFRKPDFFGRHFLEYLIEKSPCQVISFLSGASAMDQWKQVVIPVTDFIPETRIHTIAEIARTYHLKIHLVAIASNHQGQHSNDFYFLTETLKKLKHVGNIQVTCKCLKEQGKEAIHFLKYAKEVGADILMTSQLFSREYKGVSLQTQFLFEYV